MTMIAAKHLMAGMAMLACAAAPGLLVAAPAWADEPDGLILPKGFHATVVADGLVNARHIAVRANGDLYISTLTPRNSTNNMGVYAVHIGADGKAAQVEHFSTVSGGTGIGIYKGALYTASTTAIYRFDLGDALVPAAAPTLVLDGMPATGEANRIITFDKSGGMLVAVGAAGNICTDTAPPPAGTKPVGLNPCPSLNGRAGIWRFAAGKTGLKFPADGTQFATGLRDMAALSYRSDGALYGFTQDRNNTAATWPEFVSAADEDNIAEEMHRIVKGADLGWPTTYYDAARNVRLLAPEYGGDGKKEAPKGKFSTPVIAFAGHSSPLDVVFYTGKQFPKEYRGGAFVAMHGGTGPAVPGGHNGYNLVFVPFDAAGHADGFTAFADGFAGPASARNASTAAYRPVGLAQAPDGGLYVMDGQKGKLWKISYSGI